MTDFPEFIKKYRNKDSKCEKLGSLKSEMGMTKISDPKTNK